jgi:hypothetical protein
LKFKFFQWVEFSALSLFQPLSARPCALRRLASAPVFLP